MTALKLVAVGDNDFAQFWTLYPRRVAKKDALKAWSKIDPKLHPEILESLIAWLPFYSRRPHDRIPHPATWLNGERWTDELPTMVRGPESLAELRARNMDVLTGRTYAGTARRMDQSALHQITSDLRQPCLDDVGGSGPAGGEDGVG